MTELIRVAASAQGVPCEDRVLAGLF